MSAPELKPCPFCGGKANAGFFPGDYDISCDNCQFSISRHISDCGGEDEAKATAVLDWNTRADLCDPTQDERVKALVEAAQAQLDYMDMCREHGDLERNLRAALRALEQGKA